MMIYHKWSMVGYMLWLRYGLGTLRPWRSLTDIYAQHLESPGTKAYTKSEARAMLSDFAAIKISTPLGHADLLTSEVGQRHRDMVLKLAKKFWPRWLIRRLLPAHGSGMMIDLRE